jgi:hypothetical protein
VLFCLFVARSACGEIRFEDTRENLHHDGLGRVGQPKGLTEIREKYVLLRFILKTRRWSLLQVLDTGEDLGVNIENRENGRPIHFFVFRRYPEGTYDRVSRAPLDNGWDKVCPPNSQMPGWAAARWSSRSTDAQKVQAPSLLDDVSDADKVEKVRSSPIFTILSIIIRALMWPDLPLVAPAAQRPPICRIAQLLL